MATRWAICGAGLIARDFCTAMRCLPSSEHKIVAVAASSAERAAEFAADFEIPTSFGSYKELIDVPDVDVIYVATIHTLHVDTCLMYINAGKNVLCEKPMALSIEGCRKVLSAAKEKGVLFIEAFWSRFFPAYKFILDQIGNGTIGDVNMVQASFSAAIMHIPRVNDIKLGGGGLMDLGCYIVQAANLVFKGIPVRVLADSCLTEGGVDKQGVVLLRYSGDRQACLAYNCESPVGNNSLIIRGTKGCFKIPDFFWCPSKVILPDGQTKDFPLPVVKEHTKYHFGFSQGLSYEAQGVRECLLKGLKESPHIPHEDSETIMNIQQQILAQIGVTYNCL